MLRSTALGAALLAVITAPGTCVCLYRWIVTGNVAHLGEAVCLLLVAAFMGGAGGAAYNLVTRSRIKSTWKPLLAPLAAVEAYLLAFSIPAMLIGLVAPKLDLGLPSGLAGFILGVHAYGAVLCLVAFGFVYAPRVAQVAVGSIGLVCMLLLVAMMALLFMIGPEKLDLWFAFLRPLGIAIWLLLPAVAVVSIAGWVRYCRKASRGVSEGVE